MPAVERLTSDEPPLWILGHPITGSGDNPHGFFKSEANPSASVRISSAISRPSDRNRRALGRKPSGNTEGKNETDEMQDP